MKICFFGAFDRSYARNDYIWRSLELAGNTISSCNTQLAMPTYKKYPALIKQFMALPEKPDLLFVPAFGQTIVPLAWLLGKLFGILVAFDSMVGMYETTVIERKRYRPNSFHGKKLYWVDKISLDLPKKVITGTRGYRKYLSESFSVNPKKIFVAPLGVNDELFPLQTSDDHENVRVLFLGSFIPNHGVPHIVDAARLLAEHEHIQFTFLGDGEGKPAAQQQVAEYGLTNITFKNKVSIDKLPDEIAAADIVLGNFGDTAQSQKAMAQKIVQGLCMQRTVLAGDTPATRELLTHGEDLWLVPPGNPQALADGVIKLANDPALRECLARHGRKTVLNTVTPKAISTNLHQFLFSD